MATNHKLFTASPARIFAVLMDADAYADWVVGAHKIRGTDSTWPAVGARFHHRVGIGPFKLNDHTEVIELEPDRKLVLHARARPLGTAVVTLLLEPRESGTLVTMHESAGDALSRIGINPLTDWLIQLRNTKALQRLARISDPA